MYLFTHASAYSFVGSTMFMSCYHSDSYILSPFMLKWNGKMIGISNSPFLIFTTATKFALSVRNFVLFFQPAGVISNLGKVLNCALLYELYFTRRKTWLRHMITMWEKSCKYIWNRRQVTFSSQLIITYNLFSPSRCPLTQTWAVTSAYSLWLVTTDLRVRKTQSNLSRFLLWPPVLEVRFLLEFCQPPPPIQIYNSACIFP